MLKKEYIIACNGRRDIKPVPVRACELAAQRALQVLIVDGQRSLVENTELIEQLFGLPRQ